MSGDEAFWKCSKQYYNARDSYRTGSQSAGLVLESGEQMYLEAIDEDSRH